MPVHDDATSNQSRRCASQILSSCRGVTPLISSSAAGETGQLAMGEKPYFAAGGTRG